MSLGTAGASKDRAVHLGESAGELRSRWRRESALAGWAFPSDWYSTAVDAVVEAALAGDGLGPAGWRLGQERARGAVGLAETLRDIDALIAALPVSPADQGSALVRSVSLGWADGTVPTADPIVDGLTGMVGLAYLGVRLGEVYRAAESEGCSASATHALVVVRVQGVRQQPWGGSLTMALVADGLRTVFSGGQTIARISAGVAVVLTAREQLLGRRVAALTELVARHRADGDLRPAACGAVTQQVWIERLPSDRHLIPRLLHDLAR